MNTSIFKETAAALALATASAGIATFQPVQAQGQSVVLKTVDNPDFAKRIGDYITSNCPRTDEEATKSPEKAMACIDAALSGSKTVLVNMSKHIENVTAITNPLNSGIANGHLMRFCEWPLKEIAGKKYPLNEYMKMAFEKVKGCEEAFVTAGKAVGIDYQPTARNTVSCHMNQIRGFKCADYNIKQP